MIEGVFGRSDAEIDLLVRGKLAGIAVVGFGYIGTVIGAVLADRETPVTGTDGRQTILGSSPCVPCIPCVGMS